MHKLLWRSSIGLRDTANVSFDGLCLDSLETISDIDINAGLTGMLVINTG